MSILWDIKIFGTVLTTQTPVMEQAVENDAPEGFGVQALSQSEGQGRRGNIWESPMGNLYLSVLLRPHCTPDEAGQMAFVVALAISRALDSYMQGGHSKRLKWPNDILIDGKKIAGILLETHLDSDGTVDALVIGMGVNVLAPPEGAIGLSDLCAAPVAIHPFRDQVLACLDVEYRRWQSDGFVNIRADWLAQAYGIGAPITVRLGGDKTHEGLLIGIDDDGALLVQNADGSINRLTSGDVCFI